VKTTDVEIMHIDVKNSISKHEFGVQNIENKIVGNRYEPKVALEDEVYSKTYLVINQGVLQWMELQKKKRIRIVDNMMDIN
jgi:hypothetical protein